ncbi:MAG: hypothetical protein FWG97_05625 [Deltaproteobacteria bacterium]|nr:hypothetical protein [Deltaproteobacteria bacterium]
MLSPPGLSRGSRQAYLNNVLKSGSYKREREKQEACQRLKGSGWKIVLFVVEKARMKVESLNPARPDRKLNLLENPPQFIIKLGQMKEFFKHGQGVARHALQLHPYEWPVWPSAGKGRTKNKSFVDQGKRFG